MKKAAVILSGCGHLDGSEIHEATLLYLALAEKGISYHSFAPDRDMAAVINHKTHIKMSEKRNILVESARIARGDVESIRNLREADFSILCFPGGGGVARNLSTLAEAAERYTVDSEIARLIVAFYVARKPIIGLCIAPAIISKALENKGIKMTLGTDPQSLSIIKNTGNTPVSCLIDEACIDSAHHIYTVPAYMEPPSIFGIYTSLKRVMAAL